MCSHLTVICPGKDEGNPGNVPAAASSPRGHREDREPPQRPEEHREQPLGTGSTGNFPSAAPTRLGGGGTAHAQTLSATVSTSLRCLHGRGEIGGRADAGPHSGAFPRRCRLLRTPCAWVTESGASHLPHTQYAAAALREEEEATHGMRPSLSGGMVRPAGGTPVLRGGRGC